MSDHGANINTKTKSGQTPLLYAATQGKDDIAMYLALRSKNLDMEDKDTGLNVLNFYLLK